MCIALPRVFAAAALAAACAWMPPLDAAAQTPAAPSGNGTPASAQRNAYAAGSHVRPGAAVGGDFSAVGGKVIVDQPIGADASLAGGSVDVRAPVGEDLRAAGGDVTIESTVGGELIATGGSVNLARSAVIARDAQLFGGNVAVDGRVDGELNVKARKITIDGEVRGNARLAADQIELGPNARMQAALTYASSAELTKAPGAVVAGAVTRDREFSSRRVEHAPMGHAPGAASFWMGGVVSFIALLACAALFLLLLPRFSASASDRIRTSAWLAVGAGLGTAIAVPIVAVLLFITVIGIPLGFAVMALYPALLLSGLFIGVLFVARLIPGALHRPAPTAFAGTLGYFAVGLLLALLATAVPLVGALVVGMLSLAGLGACVLELRHRRSAPREPAPVDSPQQVITAQAH